MNRRHAIKNAVLLFGATLSAPTLLAMSRWENSDFSDQNDFVLSNTQQQIIADVAEAILPKTKTPGAKDAGVPAFIIMMLNDCYKTKEQDNFLAGITQLEQANFLQKNVSEQTALLKKLEVDTKLMKDETNGTPFWKLMKELTLLGYYSSEVGIKASFDYEPIPGKLEMIKLKPGQRSIVY